MKTRSNKVNNSSSTTFELVNLRNTNGNEDNSKRIKKHGCLDKKTNLKILIISLFSAIVLIIVTILCVTILLLTPSSPSALSSTSTLVNNQSKLSSTRWVINQIPLSELNFHPSKGWMIEQGELKKGEWRMNHPFEGWKQNVWIFNLNFFSFFSIC